MLEVQGWAETDVGRVRAQNQDAFLVDPELCLYVVCDGMGGMAAGDVASTLATEAVGEAMRRARAEIDGMPVPPGRDDRVRLLELLEGAVHEACSRVFEDARAHPERQGMGTTLTALLCVGGRGFVAHVGDSRAYLLRRGQVHLLTEDHTVIHDLLRTGRVTPEKAKDLPFQGALSRAVGYQASVTVDRLEFQLCGGDRYLLCSDGLHRYLSHGDLTSILGAGDPSAAARRFVEVANEGGGEDNVTAAVVVVGDAQPAAQETLPVLAAEHYQRRVDTLREIPLFRQLSDREMMKFMAAMEEHRYPVGTALTHEGEAGDTLHVVLEGRAEVRKGDLAIAEVSRGGHIGELALLDEAPRSATVVTTEPTRTLSIGRAVFHQLLKSDPALSNKVLWCFLHMLSGRLRATSDELTGAVSQMARLTEVPDIF